MDQDTRYALWLKKMGLVNSNMDRRYHFNEFDALRARLAAATARVEKLEGLLREARSEILHMGDGATELTDEIRAVLRGEGVQGE